MELMKVIEFNINFLNDFLDKTSNRLTIETQRYGGGFCALATTGIHAEMLLDMLSGADLEATSTQFFLWENSLLPVAFGRTVGETIHRLNAKLEVLYIKDNDGYFKPQFTLEALHDPSEDDKTLSFYNVEDYMIFDDVYSFLKELKNECEQKGIDSYSSSWYWYETLQDKCSQTKYRNFHALLNYKWPDDLKKAIDIAENI